MPDQTRDPGCEPVADALPDLLHGRLAGEARSRAERHVATCERCASELALLGGARAAIRGDAPALDVAAIAAAVRAATVPDARAVRPPRRAAPPRVTAPSRWRAGAGPRAVVAAMLLAVGAGTVWFTDRTITGSFTATPAVDAAGPPADATARADSQASAPTVLAAADPGLGAGFDDLSDDELQAVIAAVEGSDRALPSEEPVLAVPGIDEAR